MRYNINNLKSDADCRHIAEYIGMRISGQYCECVSGLHAETRINHCAIYRNKIHCFSCGDSRDVVDMVRGYFANKLGNPISYMDACKIIGDALGGHELYQEKGKGPVVKKLPFTTEELDLIGIDQFTKIDPEGQTISAIYRNNEQQCILMLRSKVEAEMGKISLLIERLGNSFFESSLKMELRNRYSLLKTMYNKIGGAKSVRPMFKI